MPRRSSAALAAPFVLVALASCSNATSGGAPPPGADGGDTGGAPANAFTPKGCGFTVGFTTTDDAFPEGQTPTFQPSSPTLGAAPAPRFSRIGLGGGTDASKPGYADPSTTVGVVWQTDAATLASQIRLGESEAALATTADGYSYLLPHDGASGPADGVRFHEAYVCGLTPGRTYYYQVGGGPAAGEVWSKTASFTTAPARGGKDPIVFGFAGDSRDALGRSDLPIWKAIGGRVQAGGGRLLAFSGDFVFTGVDQGMWDRWSKAADGFAPNLFVAMAPGNHENERIRYFAQSMMPGAVGSNYERYASFDYGPVHFVMVDDYDGIVSPSVDVTDYRTEVLAWLEADLTKADANRAAVPWVVAFHHHPFFSSTDQTDRAAEMVSVRGAFQATYDKHHVDLDLAGHDHFYERSKPIVGDAAAAKGTVYVICAAGGAPSYGVKPGNPLSEKTVLYDPDKLEGIYALVTADPTTFAVKVYKMGGPTGSTPADDTVVDDFKLTR